MARRAKKAVVWVSKEFELLALASALPLDLGWVDSFDGMASVGRRIMGREPLWSFKVGKSQIFSLSDFIRHWLFLRRILLYRQATSHILGDDQL